MSRVIITIAPIVLINLFVLLRQRGLIPPLHASTLTLARLSARDLHPPMAGHQACKSPENGERREEVSPRSLANVHVVSVSLLEHQT